MMYVGACTGAGYVCVLLLFEDGIDLVLLSRECFWTDMAHWQNQSGEKWL